ncbi:hypothetical protein BU23DRAFT_29022 [Bimuria novae-zelandiae CBS 107.79]|uniref:Uncharacterized protein n=1 Tax=Bimuria novae-zelandiae CBS 107.79 TaxID=1447943 RepID=A0A6A5VIP4_9PLEO|nr:hypothetical protein BU23DRAFT_29022 [Bimuria novae-zelandiae CBS 107.79]
MVMPQGRSLCEHPSTRQSFLARRWASHQRTNIVPTAFNTPIPSRILILQPQTISLSPWVVSPCTCSIGGFIDRVEYARSRTVCARDASEPRCSVESYRLRGCAKDQCGRLCPFSARGVAILSWASHVEVGRRGDVRSHMGRGHVMISCLRVRGGYGGVEGVKWARWRKEGLLG